MIATLWSLLVITGVLLICAGVGGAICSRARLIPEGACCLDRLLVQIAVGMGIVTYTVLALGLVGCLHPAILFGAVFLEGAVCWRWIGRSARDSWMIAISPWKWAVGEVRYRGRRLTGFGVLAALSLTLLYSLCLLVGGLAPPGVNSYDSLTYHLAVPALYLQWGQIRYDPYILHSNFPQLMEMLYLLGLAAKIRGVQAFHFFLGLMAAGVCASLARPYGRVAALLAAMAFWFTPIVGFEASIGYDDLAFAFFEGLAFLALIRYSNAGDRRWLCIAGIAQGLSCSVKYSALAFIPPLFIIAAVFTLNPRPSTPTPHPSLLRCWLILGGWILLAASPWYLRTLVWTHNPVFPYFYGILGGRNWSQDAADTYRMLQRQYGTGHNFVDFFQAPWHLLTLPQRYYEPSGSSIFAIAFGSVAPALLLLPGVALLLGRPTREAGWFAAGFGLFIVEWYLLMQQVRYLIPGLPMLAPLWALGVSDQPVEGLSGSGGPETPEPPIPRERQIASFARLLTVCVLALSFAWSTFETVQLTMLPQGDGSALMVDLGLQSPEEYLATVQLRDLYPVSEWVSLNLSAEAHLAIIGEPRIYYFSRDVAWADGHEQEKLRYSDLPTGSGILSYQSAASDSIAAEALTRGLQENRFQYVVVRLGSKLGLAQQYGVLPRGAPAAWTDIDYQRSESRWLYFYAAAVQQGLLQQVYPTDLDSPTDLGGYTVYRVSPTPGQGAKPAV